MLVSYRWLRELLPGLTASPDEVADALSGVGLTVDAVTKHGESLRPLVVAEVVAINPHPKLDKVRLVTVDRGGTQQEIVCGAKNVPAPGGKVVLAPLGTQLPAAGFTIVPRKIGGVVSEGMLVSESELGLAAESEGILVLEDPSLEPGAAFVDVRPEADDTIFEIDVTPNRPDALGHVGVARDLAALWALELELPPSDEPKPTGSGTLSELVQVSVEDRERCPHYGAAAVQNVHIKASPEFMRWRLHRLGVRPISNVVDVTNWLLLEFGQPLHAFDLRFVRGGKILVRRARPQEPFTSLDGIDRKLDEDDLVICDGEGPVALAGIMGGADSEIRQDTTDVLLECAYFTTRGVRRTARRHGMHTESSHRFERGTDFGGVERVLSRAKRLLVELANGQAVAGAIHEKGATPKPPRVLLRSARLNQLLGMDVPFRSALDGLVRLGFELSAPASDPLTAELTVPSFRPDVSMEADLIEEVARLQGLDQIPTRLPRVAPEPPKQAGKLERDTARIAVELGLSEALTYAFVSEAELAAVHAPPPVVRLENPLSEDRNVLRTSLLPGLLEALKRARRRGEGNARLFSVGARFLAPTTKVSSAAREARPSLPGDGEALPHERPSFAAVIAGFQAEYLSLKPAEVDVYDAKGVAVELVERLSRRRVEVRHVGATPATRHLHPRSAGALVLEGQVVGYFGPLHPELVEALDLGGSALVVEVDLASVEETGKRTPKYAPIPKLPAVTRDISLVVSEDIAAGRVAELLQEAAGALCESVALQAVFRGGSVPPEHRSLTFRMVYRDPNARLNVDQARTLTDKEVDQQQSAVIKKAQQALGATLRG